MRTTKVAANRAFCAGVRSLGPICHSALVSARLASVTTFLPCAHTGGEPRVP